MAQPSANENFPLPVVNMLRQYGHDVLTIQETGYANQAMTDEAVLLFATTEKRIVLTFNRKHFIHLHQKKYQHAGIVVCTYDPDFVALAQRIHHALELHEEQVYGQLIRIYRPTK